MNKLLIILLLTTGLSSCRRCTSTYDDRLKGVKKVCPTCTYIMSEMDYYAVDTSKQPNIIYKVKFKSGGIHTNAWDVDELIKVN